MTPWEDLIEAYTGHRNTRKIFNEIDAFKKEVEEAWDDADEAKIAVRVLSDKLQKLKNRMLTIQKAASKGGAHSTEVELNSTRSHTDRASGKLDVAVDYMKDSLEQFKHALKYLTYARTSFTNESQSGQYKP